jgi:hypothetical protein
MKALLAVWAVAAALASGCGAGSGASAPDRGVTGVGGRYLLESHLPNAQRAHPPGQPVVIGLFDHPLPVIGPEPLQPPRPLARAKTGARGRFLLLDVKPGRYFVAPIGVRELARGRWVRVRPGRVTRVVLYGCSDCVQPKAGAGAF